MLLLLLLLTTFSSQDVLLHGVDNQLVAPLFGVVGRSELGDPPLDLVQDLGSGPPLDLVLVPGAVPPLELVPFSKLMIYYQMGQQGGRHLVVMRRLSLIHI